MMLKAWRSQQLGWNPLTGSPFRVSRLPRQARPSARRAAPQAQQPEDADVRPSVPPPEDELPPELKDVAINEDGFLIDTKTGKVINEMGATRFDVAVRALRGELDPPEWVENSERTPGVLLSALYQFPRAYLFQVVGRPEPVGTAGAAAAAACDGKASFVDHVTATIARVTQSAVETGKVEVKERLGGKYVSVGVEVVVRAPELVTRVYEELGTDPRVIMRF